MENKPDYDLIVCGGGIAGAAAAITQKRLMPDARVLLLESGSYPRHKVCGEYFSSEAISLLRSLLDSDFTPNIHIERVAVHAGSATAHFNLPFPAFSISRFELDSLLWNRAAELGIQCRQDTRVLRVTPGEAGYAIETRNEVFHAKCAIDATGRWSELCTEAPPARKLIGIKCHYETGRVRPSLCSLYFFRGGYLGFQAISENCIDAAALVDARLYRDMSSIFKAAGMVDVVSDWQPRFAPITCAPLRLGIADPIRNGIFCCGDAAGFIDPFAGDGMSLAMHSGTLAAQFCPALIDGRVRRDEALEQYSHAYTKRFASSFRSAAFLRRVVFAPEWIQRASVNAMRLPGLGRFAHARTRPTL